MKIIIVLSFDVSTPDDVPAIIKALDPPSAPFFDGAARIAVEPHSTSLIDWLDGNERLNGLDYSPGVDTALSPAIKTCPCRRNEAGNEEKPS